MMYYSHKSNESLHFMPRKTTAKAFLTCVVLALLCASSLCACFLMETHYTEITDISSYGVYPGTNSPSFTKDYINSIFPEKIDPLFEVMEYSYKAENNDSYGFEAFLKFHITDPDMFLPYVDSLAPPEAWKEFPFSEEYLEYSVENMIDISPYQSQSTSKPNSYPIEYARIRKILYSPTSQTVIFFALGVYDGGGVNTGYFCSFFEHFSIDPIVYEQTSDARYGRDPFGTDILTGDKGTVLLSPA